MHRTGSPRWRGAPAAALAPFAPCRPFALVAPFGSVALLASVALIALASALSAQTARVVGEGGAYATISQALGEAGAGDTILVGPGVYRERPVIATPVTLIGREGAVLAGGGIGTVLTITEPATVVGLTIRGSGRDLSREDAGVMVLDADDVTIRDLRLEDVLFGIYVKESARPRILDNVIEGKPLPVAQRGDGIRLWYCTDGEVAGNRLERSRDLVIWFSSGFAVRGNLVRDSRYGLHYMYSDRNRFEDNEFRDNQVGAFLMYSSHIEFRGNRFLASEGATGVGLGLKDADHITAEGNAFVGNAVGIAIDNSPTSVGVTNRFRANRIAYNGVGISLLPSVHSNVFEANELLENATPVEVSGGGDALRNRWEGNRWSDYAGFDADGDGVGDAPYRHDRIADELFARHPDLKLFAMSPSAEALEVLGRFFPLLRPRPVVVDSAPALTPRRPETTEGRAPGDVPAVPEPAEPVDEGGTALDAALPIAAAFGALALALVTARRPRRLR